MGSASMASEESLVPSPVSTTLSPSLCLHPAATEPSDTTTDSQQAKRLEFIPRPLTRRERTENFEQTSLALHFFEDGHQGTVGRVPRYLNVIDVGPGLAREGARLNRRYVDAALGEMLEHVEERPVAR